VAEAQELGVRALELAEEVGDEWAIGTALGQLSDLALLQGDLARCIDISSRGIAVLRQVGDTLNVAMVTANLALAHLLRGDAGEAERLYGEVLEVGRHQRDPELVGIALLGVATCCAGDGRTERAAFLLGASGSIFGEVGVVLPPNEATVRDETIARVTAVLGETAFRAAWERGAAIALASATTDLWSVKEPLEAASVVERADRGHA
jgi:hypothetical protein